MLPVRAGHKFEGHEIHTVYHKCNYFLYKEAGIDKRWDAWNIIEIKPGEWRRKI